MNLRPLCDLRWIQSANVRGALPLERLALFPARRRLREGDVVAGRVLLPDGVSELPILDAEARVHVLRRSGADEAPPLVLAPVGSADSATHANGGVPRGGLAVERGVRLAWLAGESGLVGELFREASAPGGPASAFGVEHSAPFVCEGAVVRLPASGGELRSFNVGELAVAPRPDALRTPILAIAATASELGKTTLACGVLASLCRAAPGARALRVAAVKPTGIGGLVDGLRHAQAGACAVFDVVDSGLPTSYTSERRFTSRLPRILLAAQQAGAELIVAELGGDLCAANNPTWLASRAVRERLVGVAVLCGDNLAALGADAMLREVLGAGRGAPPRLWFASPHRNLLGMQRRAARLGPGGMLDPRDPAAVARLAALGRRAAAARRSASGVLRPPALDAHRNRSRA